MNRAQEQEGSVDKEKSGIGIAGWSEVLRKSRRKRMFVLGASSGRHTVKPRLRTGEVVPFSQSIPANPTL